ncbi:TOPRIM nucleotidyl transferase/hydrolase domain-containing protein [Sulfurisphaera ohwakuensis]|uniref:TOPRIM nucleotidyl transferase/hydrolase domain-containing protein n=1 Tax=Sulfurisphaera ohwakuensis TaxID=69656 RepID=UPI0036F3B82F
MEKCLVFYKIKNINPTIKSKFDEIILCEGKTEVEVIKSLYNKMERYICERTESRKRVGIIDIKGIGNLNRFIEFFTKLYKSRIIENNTLYIIMDKDLFDTFKFKNQCKGEGKLLECSDSLRIIIALNYNKIEDELQLIAEDEIAHGDVKKIVQVIRKTD